MTHFQDAANKRREDLVKAHQTEIEALKSDHARIAADLLAQKEAEEASKRDLIESHRVNVESLTSTKDAALADAESRAKSLQEELQADIQKLTDAVAKAQGQFMVLTVFPSTSIFSC